LLEAQLLRPLDIVAVIVHIDARPRDLKLIENLDGLELHDPATAEPGKHEILRHLRLRSGCRAGGRACLHAAEGH